MRKLQHDEIRRQDPRSASTFLRHPITVLLDNIRSLHNVGSIFRTSDAAGVERIIVTGYTATPENPALHRTALGAQDTVPWEYTNNAEDAVRQLREEGYTIAVLEITDTPTSVRDLKAGHYPLCLIVGNEVIGVQDSLVAAADLAIEIPQFGAKHSLNASVAFGVAVYGLLEQYYGLQEG